MFYRRLLDNNYLTPDKFPEIKLLNTYQCEHKTRTKLNL